jgi:adenylate kinase
MRVVVTGQVGTDKQPFLERVAQFADAMGYETSICHVGDMMYAEAPDVAPGRILDLPLSRLQSLRRSVFKDVLRIASEGPNVLINTHATFRWRHGLFTGFDIDTMQKLDADIYVVLTDNVDRMHHRLVRDGHAEHTLKDLMVWREEEALATELLAQIVRGHGAFYLFSRGDSDSTAEALARLIYQPGTPKAYLSFPMTHVMDLPDTLAEIEAFRRRLKELFVCFDPADLEEKYLTDLALNAAKAGQHTVTIGEPQMQSTVTVADLLAITGDIDGQIYARDFKLIDQADMIISLVPELPDGRPGLSSGVERELQHAHEGTKEVYVIWKPGKAPSPFITGTATRVFTSVTEAMDYFASQGYAAPSPPGGLFT